MISQEHDLDQVEAPALPPLFAMQAERMALAAASLRQVQALAGAYAAMLEVGAHSVDDIDAVGRAFYASIENSYGALATFGASLQCKGAA